MHSNTAETLVGAVVILIAGAFLLFAFNQTEHDTSTGYTILARVDNAVGIRPGTDVRVAGVKAGTVTDVAIDDRYRAVITMLIEDRIELPEDSSMRVGQEGLLGGTYIRLEPGGSIDYMLEDGDELSFATGSVDLIGLVQQAIFGAGGGNNSDE